MYVYSNIRSAENAPCHKTKTLLYSFLLSLALQSSLSLGLLHKIRLNFLEAFQQFSFLHGRFVSPTPNPHPGGPGLCIYIGYMQYRKMALILLYSTLDKTADTCI
jgi:hypothetical protein